MINAEWCSYRLQFNFPAKTSRAEMSVKDTYFIRVWDNGRPDVYGIGECALFRGLSAEDTPGYEEQLAAMCRSGLEVVPESSSLRFGAETALTDLRNGGCRMPFASEWQDGHEGIGINGLVWMGDKATMLRRIEDKIAQGFKTLKLKIGGIDFDDETELLQHIRRRFSSRELEIRLDANGSFTPANAMERLERLSRFDIHSIEQPIKAGQPEQMADLCRRSPVAIALDEELTGWRSQLEQRELLEAIRPRYIILKPALCGGFDCADRWIEEAGALGIGWWATSALESNIGLNAIARWVSRKRPAMVQGLGTGGLYTNNIPSPLEVRDAKLWYNPAGSWQIPPLQWQR